MTYSIREMARLLGVAPSTIRYYDKEGLLPFLTRSPRGVRQFEEEDLATLRLIQCLKKTGLSIQDIRTFMTLPPDGEETIQMRLAMLQKQRAMLQEKRKELQTMAGVVDYKIWFYQAAQRAGSIQALQHLPETDIPEKYRAGKKALTSQSD